jgi:hypothetical protein
MNAALEEDRWPPLRIAAHAVLWPGIAAGLLAGIGGYLGWRYANRYDEALDSGVAEKARTWTGVMWGAGGASAALLTASLVCLLLHKKAAKLGTGAPATAIGGAPATDGNGIVLVLGRGF